jgi:hypothetical protein
MLAAQAHDVHPLLRHPRPITRESAKAQRMLGLIADSEEKTSGLHREKSKTTKWLERPLYAHLDLSDVESDQDGDQSLGKPQRTCETGDYEKDALLLEQWTSTARPTTPSSEEAVQKLEEPKTKLESPFAKRRPEPLDSLRALPHSSQNLLTPEWTASPIPLSPNVQRPRPVPLQPHSPNMQEDSFASIRSSGLPQLVHPQTWPRPPNSSNRRAERPVSYQPPNSLPEQDSFSFFNNAQSNNRRPRPLSYATYQHRDRRNSKIASSRGLRNDSYPNFSRPISEIVPKAVPGEHLESNAVYNRFADDEAKLQSLNRGALDGFESSAGKSRDEKKAKNRWSSIPQTLKKFTNRRSSATLEPHLDDNVDDFCRVNLTADNLRRASLRPATPIDAPSGVKLLPTPTYSPLDFEHPLYVAPLPPPFAPWADGPPSPASTQEQRRDSDMSFSPPNKRRQSRLSVESTVQSPSLSLHSRRDSFGLPSAIRDIPHQPQKLEPCASPRTISRRGTPSLERTCIVCKTTKDSAAFVNRRISGNCWHEPATCFQCLQWHIEKCVTELGWDHCNCPECGEHLAYEDIGALADDDNTLIRWED